MPKVRDDPVAMLCAQNAHIVTSRLARTDDVARLVAMNHAAYPELVEENVVWSAGQIRSHLARFPEGLASHDRRGDSLYDYRRAA